jgi:host factor-I protein
MMKKTAAGKSESEGVESAQSAQDHWLTRWANERTKVAVFLVNGVKIEGEIVSFDRYVILLKAEMTCQIYKHAVSTIQPVTGVRSKVDVSVKKPRLGRPQ